MRVVKRQTTFWEFADATRHCCVHFTNKKEQRFVEGEFENVEIVSNHPVLDHYFYPWSSVFIAKPPNDPGLVLKELTDLVASEYQHWRHPFEYFNRQYDTLTLLRAGFGLLLDAPKPFAEKVCRHLDSAGVEWSSLPSRPPQPPLQALIAGLSFVIAEGFRIE